MALHHNPRIVTSGLVLALDAGDVNSYPGSGTTWYDLSGNGYNSTLANGPTYSSANRGVIIFDGTNDSSGIPYTFSGLTSLTVNLFYYSNVNASTALTGGSGNSFLLHFRGAGFYIVDSNNVASGYLGWNSTIPHQSWVMITGTWDGNTMKLYQNGNKQASELAFTGTGVLKTTSQINLGYYFNVAQPWTNGSISNYQIYNRALSASEIEQNYLAQKSRFGL